MSRTFVGEEEWEGAFLTDMIPWVGHFKMQRNFTWAKNKCWYFRAHGKGEEERRGDQYELSKVCRPASCRAWKAWSLIYTRPSRSPGVSFWEEADGGKQAPVLLKTDRKGSEDQDDPLCVSYTISPDSTTRRVSGGNKEKKEKEKKLVYVDGPRDGHTE